MKSQCNPRSIGSALSAGAVGRSVERSAGRLVGGRLVLSVGRLVLSVGRAVGWSAGRLVGGRLVVALLTVGGGVELVVCVRHAALWRADDARIGG